MTGALGSLQGTESLPRRFLRNGYWTAAAGKFLRANRGGQRGALTDDPRAPFASQSGLR